MPINGRDKEKARAAWRKYYARKRLEILAKKAEVSPAYYAAHREEILAKKKAEYAANPNAKKEYHRAYNQAHRSERRAKLLERYGLTHEAFATLLASQGSACAICKASDWGKRGPFVDHDHRTGQVRGILCFRCNSALGYANDNPHIVRAMGEYLSKFNGQATDLQDSIPS